MHPLISMTDQELIQHAQSTLQVEIHTLEQLRDTIGSPFATIVRRIYASTGRLVVTGIGKSALVAQKIVATLNSTGTPALFMHAADAIHGDLGMITDQDLVLCLSKSGETPEIKALIPLINHLGSATIGMTSNAHSTLAQQADYFLHTPIEQEADPNNLAPTASTTAQMALGDAIAISLLALRGFTASDFARYHPGGALGKQLYLKVSDLYPENARPLNAPTDTLQTVILEISSKRLGATVITDGHDRVHGIITDGDLRRMLSQRPSLDGLTAADVCTPAPKTILPDTLAAQALQVMRQHSITQLVVADATGHYLGMIHLHDLLRQGLV